MLLLVGAYAYFTRPARLRNELLRALASLPGAAVEVGHVSFSLRDGLEIVDLTLRPRGGRGAPERLPTDDLRAEFHVAHARVRCDLFALLGGKMRPREVGLSGVEVSIVCPRLPRAASAPPDTDADLAWWRDITARLPGVLPAVRIEDAGLRVLVAGDDDERLVKYWRLSGSGRADGETYALRLERPGAAAPPLAEARWDHARRELDVAADWLELETVARFLPAAWANACAGMNLRGRGRIDRVVFAEDSGVVTADIANQPNARWRLTSMAMRFADLCGSVPIEADPEDSAAPALPASDRFVQFDNAEVAIELKPDNVGGATLALRGTGKVNGAPAVLDFAGRSESDSGTAGLADALIADLRVDGLAFPTHEEHPQFVTSPRLPRGLRNFFNDFRPRGSVNLRMRVTRELSGEGGTAKRTLRAEGEVEALGDRCRYRRFPYDFEDVRGRLRFSPAGLFFEDIVAQHGSAQVRANGILNAARRAAGFDLHFEATNVPLDGDLYAALPPKYRRLWEQAAPLGLCDARVNLRREDGSPEADVLPPTDVRVDARLLSGSLLVNADERLHGAEGRFSIADNVLAIEALRGRLDGDAVRISGTVGVEGSGIPTELRIEGMDVAMQHTAEIPGAPGEPAAEIRFVGRGDVWGHLTGGGLRGDRKTEYTVHVKDGVLTGFSPDEVWEDCAGWIRVGADGQEIRLFTARQGDARLAVTGTLPAPSKSGPVPSLEMQITDAAMDRLVPQMVPPRWLSNVDALGLAGPGQITLRLRPESAADAPNRQVAEFDVKAARLRPTPLPISLEEVNARASVTADGIELHRAHGRYGSEGQITLTGRSEWGAGRRAGEFDVSARALDMSDELVDAMPKALARLLRRLEPGGRLDVELDRVRFVETAGEATWEFDGRVAFEGGELQLGLPLTDFDGQMSGTCTIRPDGELELDAGFTIAEGRLAGRPIENWEGRIEREAGEQWVRLEDLRGRLCGGDALGFIHIDPVSSAYELSLTIQDVNLDQLLPRKAGDDGPPRRGRVGGRVFLRGNADEVASRSGGGDLRIRGASMLQTPVLAEVAQAKPPKQGEISDALDLAELRFVWKGAELRLSRADIQSRDLRLVGEGTWNMETDEIALLLVGAHPRHWPRMPVLTDLLETTGKELVQYRVGGTAAAPRVKAEPLYRLNEALRALLSRDD